jgi:hypothetical protein
VTQTTIGQDRSEALVTDRPLADVPVAIAEAAGGIARVVDVQRTDTIEADAPGDQAHPPSGTARRRQIVSRDVRVTRVQADADTIVVDDREELGGLVDARCDGAPAPGRWLDEHARTGDEFQRRPNGGGRAPQRGRAGAETVAQARGLDEKI